MRPSDPLRWAIIVVVFSLLGFILVAGVLLLAMIECFKLAWLALCLPFQMFQAFRQCSTPNPPTKE